MEWPNEATYDHKSGASAGASVGADINLEIKEAQNYDITAQPSEIEENQMVVAVSNTGNGMRMERAQDITEEEIMEVVDSGRLRPHVELPSGGGGSGGEDVYVAVGKSASSMDALSWALKNAVKPGSFVYLIHVFPEVQQIPMPLGAHMPKESLSKDQVDRYMNEQRTTRHQMLQKYLNLCRKSKVEYDVHLIESDQVENAIVELIPVLNIKNLVVGTSKGNLRRLKRGGTKAGIIQKNAPHYCDVKIICEGRDISTITTVPDQTPPGSPLDSENAKTKRRQQTPKSSPSPEIPSINRSRSTNNPRKENKFKKLFRYFSCKSGADVH